MRLINQLKIFSYGGRDITKFLQPEVPPIYGIMPPHPRNIWRHMKPQTENIESIIREALSRYETGRLEQG